MAFNVPPPLPSDPGWRPAPQFVHDERFGVVPFYVAGAFLAPEPPAEPFGPPDLLGDLDRELEALERRSTEALWRRSGEIAGRRLVARLAEIVAILAPLLLATPPHRRDAITLLPAPPAGSLIALRDLRPALSAAQGVVRHLIAARKQAARFSAIAEAIARDEIARNLSTSPRPRIIPPPSGSR